MTPATSARPGSARIIVGMSGGVDSSVTALLLKQQGESIAGLFMQNWDDEAQGRASAAGGRMPEAAEAQGRARAAEGTMPEAAEAQGRARAAEGTMPEAPEAQERASTAEGSPAKATDCRAEDDRRDALGICGRLEIAFHARNFAKEYWAGVFEHFLAEYRAGRTPNPDVLCNREIKFKTFLDEARALGAEKIATGHYAQVAFRDGAWRLLRAADEDKDQSYFLHQLGQEQLSATLFPIGHLRKTEVRRLAAEAGLPTAQKKDSTGICFIGERDFREFLGQYIPARKGDIRSVDGQKVGEHGGVFYYTLGQREGLFIGGIRGRSAAPWFVVGKDVAANVLYVDQGTDSEWLQSTNLRSEPAHWIGRTPVSTQFRCTAKTRYRQRDEACEVRVRDDGSLDVRFDRPQRAVTPGQSVVFYRDDECLGGAIIESSDAPSALRSAHSA